MKLEKQIVLKQGLELGDAPKKRTFVEKHFEYEIPIGPDYTASFIISQSALDYLNSSEYDEDYSPAHH